MGSARPQAFDALFQRHEAAVYQLCRAVLRDPHLGADAAQETFMRLWRALARGLAPTDLEDAGAWLRRVALNAAIDLQRRRERHTLAPLEEASAVTGSTDGAERAELRQRFERSLSQLSEGQRTIFLMRHEGGLRLNEIARLLELSPSTVKTQFARACLKLQAGLSAYRPKPESNP